MTLYIYYLVSQNMHLPFFEPYQHISIMLLPRIRTSMYIYVLRVHCLENSQGTDFEVISADIISGNFINIKDIHHFKEIKMGNLVYNIQ